MSGARAKTGGEAAAFDEMRGSEGCYAKYEPIRRWLEQTPAETIARPPRSANAHAQAPFRAMTPAEQGNAAP